MTRTIISSLLTTCSTVDDGQAIRLDFLDQAGLPASVQLPFRQAASVMMTLPRLLSTALRQQAHSDESRYVFPLGRWSIESADRECLIVTLTTEDGFEVSFSIPFATCRAMGWALRRETGGGTGSGTADDPAGPAPH
jgi:hypothetical protein